MAGQFFNKKPTDLDLNGPILSITTEPTGATGIGTTIGATGGASISMSGIATAVVGGGGSGGSGYLSYQWYEEGVGALSNGTYITGTASTGGFGSTTTLTLSNLITPTDNNRKFYFTADYVPSYTVGVQSSIVPGYTTGNAWNEPITSGVATVTVTPLIEIIAQPTNKQTLTNSTTNQHLTESTADITVNADLTDSAFSDDLTYQWYLNGEIAADGVKSISNTTGSTESSTIEAFYNSGGSHTFPSVDIDNVELTLAAGGGGGGGRDGGGPGGGGGGARAGKFTLINSEFVGKTIEFFTGRGGNGGSSGSCGNEYGNGANSSPSSGGGRGGRGGKAGCRGWSGGGGGGGSATYVKLSGGNTFVVAGGGGGGGGGSHNRGGNTGNLGSSFTSTTSVSLGNGDQGQDKGGDGGGGGGGGGGAPGGGGGAAGQDNSHGGRAGEGGRSVYDSTKSTLLSQWTDAAGQNGYANIKYTGYTSTEITTVTNTTVSGATNSTLRLSCDRVGVQTCVCKVSSATATNSPIYTDTVNVVFNTTAINNQVNVEGIGIGITATITSLDLNNGDFTLETNAGDVSTGQINNEWVLYSSEKDLDVEMDLYGGKGSDSSNASGGEGGYSRIRFTMTQNTEYVIAGLTTSINTPFLYKKGTLIACVGGGGNGAEGGRGYAGNNGGFGGGINISGNSGKGGGGGNGGEALSAGSMTLEGIFGSAVVSPLLYPGDSQAGENRVFINPNLGGRSISCTKGDYWAQQGIGACDDMGTGQFRLAGGQVVTNTASIIRGYKAGYNIIQTAGKGTNNGGRGGNGATGGDGTASDAGGGGGSGYQDGSVTVVDTRSGGSTGDAKVVLRLQT